MTRHFLIFFFVLMIMQGQGQKTMQQVFQEYEINSNNAKLENKTTPAATIDSPKTASSLPLLFNPADLIDLAKKQLGAPYRYGGRTIKGFDCSGFLGFVFGCIGFSLPRSSMEIAKIGRPVQFKEARIGDLMFFARHGNGQYNAIGHVGLVIDKVGEDIHIIHASTSRGVVIEKFSTSAYLSKTYITTRRILPY
jgi:lipoprotein Spr